MRKLYVFIVASLFLLNCSKPNEEAAEENVPDTPLSDRDLNLIEALKVDSTTKFSDLRFYDGRSIKEFLKTYDPALHDRMPGRIRSTTNLNSYTAQRDLFIARMIANGLQLSIRDNYKYEKKGPNEPEQRGIAYSYGSKQYEKRQSPTDGTCNKDLLMHGIDCSGFIYQISKSSELLLASKPDNCGTYFLENVENWNKGFSKSKDFNKLKMKLLSNVSSKDLQPGDIIVWSGSHIGLVMQNGKLIHSSGYSKPRPGKGCELNLTIKGPMVSEITDNFLSDFGSGTYKVLRLEPKDCDIGGELTAHVIVEDWDLSYMITGGHAPYSVQFQHNRVGGTSVDGNVPCFKKILQVTYGGGYKGRVWMIIRDNKGNRKDTTIILN